MNRRELIKLSASAVVTGIAAPTATAITTNAAAVDQPGPVQQWGLFEATFTGPSDGNPFDDVHLGARFTFEHRNVDVNGFYDGNGQYKVRFSPDSTGHWSFETSSNIKELAGKTGVFECIAPKAGNRGPVGTAHQFHFQYADGTPYFPFGTTCYSYGFIGAPFDKTTLQDLKSVEFNKVRICLLPKSLGRRQPVAMPFERIGPAPAPNSQQAEDGKSVSERFDLSRPNPAYFQHLEQRIQDLLNAGIEADVILFHPYDPHGFSVMGAEADDRYLRYAVARLSAYRNVWWSIANEYDLVKSKSMTDWDRFFRIVEESDPYSHLRSIHHSRVMYDNSKPWCTHASLQEYDFDKSAERLRAWNKPIIYDEIQYEGNIPSRWGNLSPEEMTYRFWRAIINGVYATHGETYMEKDDNPVWSDAGALHGTSGQRITFLRKLLQSAGTTGLYAANEPYYANAGNPGERILYYFDYHRPAEYEFPLPDKVAFKATMIDPWAMTKAPLPGTFRGKSKIELSGKPYMAVLFEKA
ncbi:MAG TPA: DUF5060 domain-containing protein [Terracidiphilus sp.]|nr:DUF5060 domain-containing protein [Terracidiphilus sp.]